MSEHSPSVDVERVRAERDLYLRLLELGDHTDLRTFIEDALSLVTEVTGAESGYLEIRDPADAAEACWSASHGFSTGEVEDVRSLVSRGIIAEAIATGQTVDTPSALLDPRFSDRGSVRTHRIEAVLCIPIGDSPPLGALYLQGKSDAEPFSKDDRARADTFVRHVFRLADHMISRIRFEGSADPTARYRTSLNVDGIIGQSEALAGLLRDVSSIRSLDVSVLLLGESGTGKSQVARVIHENGPRSRSPFVEVNCAALPEGLVESELFGAVAGAHSTASKAIEGKVAAAERGTLFLDEVGELTLAAQSKLLQLLHAKRYYRLGSSEPSVADVRLIAATNRDLETAVADGRFREDLFYRLQVLPIRVPTLAERRADIPELVRHFCLQVSERHRLPRLEFSVSAIRAAELAEWPGHVRQLAHAVEAAVVRAAGEGASCVERAHLFPDRPAYETRAPCGPTFQEATRRFQMDLLRDTLEETGWNVSEAARRLELARSHVYNLIRAFGLGREPH